MFLLSKPYPSYVWKFCEFNFNFNYRCVVKSSVCTVTIGWTFVSLRLSCNDLMIVSDGSNKRLYDRWGLLDSSLCHCFLPIFFVILSSLSRSIYFYEIYCCLLIENMLNCKRFLLKRKENIGTVINQKITSFVLNSDCSIFMSQLRSNFLVDSLFSHVFPSRLFIWINPHRTLVLKVRKFRNDFLMSSISSKKRTKTSRLEVS